MSDEGRALAAALQASLRSGLLFGRVDEPLDDYGKRLVRVILSEFANAGSGLAVAGENTGRNSCSPEPAPVAITGRLANFVELVAQARVFQSNIQQAREDVAALLPALATARAEGAAEVARIQGLLAECRWHVERTWRESHPESDGRRAWTDLLQRMAAAVAPGRFVDCFVCHLPFVTLEPQSNVPFICANCGERARAAGGGEG